MSVDLTCPTCEGTLRCGPTCGNPACRCGWCRDETGTPTGRRRPTLDEWDALVAERDRWWSKALDEYDLAVDLGNAITENAGEEWDGEDSLDSIAVRYVRWLESERDRLRTLADAAEQFIDEYRAMNGGEDPGDGITRRLAWAVDALDREATP